MEYRYYRDDYEGTIREAEFNLLLPKAEAVIKAFIDDHVRTDQLQEVLSGYGNFDKAICFEIDYLDQNGGTAAVNGASDLDLKQVQSSGYTFQMGNGGQSYKGIPFSPLARSVIMTELRRSGLLKLGWNW